MELREEIRKRRKELGLTQKQLAAQVALNNATLCAFEAGDRNLGPDALERVCAALGLRLTVEVVEDGVPS